MNENTHKQNFKPISIRDLFEEKNPSLARWIPGFVYRFLSIILRIDFMITFGKSILYQWLDDRFCPEEWANKIREFTYELANDHTHQFPYKNS